MFGASISIPAVRIGPVATESASGAKTVAAIWFFLLVVIALGSVGIAEDANRGAQDASQMFFGMAFIVLLTLLIPIRYVKAARRATAAAARASTDPSSQWFLSGRMIVGLTASGAPSPDLSFKISRKLRNMLLAVPAATVVERGKLAR